MILKNFFFSYKNLLLRSLEKKKYFSFVRKILGLVIKFFFNKAKNFFLIKFENLDNYKKIFFTYNLDKLFNNFNCDKGSYFFLKNKKIKAHKYSIFYNKYFRPLKNKKIKILEIGSHEGKGLASFFFYFPNAHFVGANINPFQMQFKSKRINEIFIDVSSEKILNNFCNHFKNNFDIIIDDASHNLRDILITFIRLFKKLNKKGIYVIEDVDQFKIFKELNQCNQNELTPVQILKNIVKKKNFSSSFLKTEDKKYLNQNIKKIKLETGSMIIKGKNASRIAFIFKK